MKIVNNLLLRGIISVLLGVLLILWPGHASHYLVIAIGLFFLLPGLLSVFNYFISGKKERASSSFPVEGAGSLLLGVLLLVFPAFFISILMYLLGVLSIIGGIGLIIYLLSGRKKAVVSFWYYVLPVLITITGVLILANPEKVVENTFIIFGVVCILFGVSLLINWCKFRKLASSN